MRRRIIPSTLIAILIEVIIFNFSAFQAQLRGITPLVLSTEQLNYLNWENVNGTLISLPDPVIYIEDIDIIPYSIVLEVDAAPMPQTCTFFYTTEENEVFSAEKMVSLPMEAENGKIIVSLPSTEPVVALRMDLGEEAGTVLNSITLRINEFKWDISISRIIAMLIIYWGAVGLMQLQKSPNYGIEMNGGDTDSNGASVSG